MQWFTQLENIHSALFTKDSIEDEVDVSTKD